MVVHIYITYSKFPLTQTKNKALLNIYNHSIGMVYIKDIFLCHKTHYLFVNKNMSSTYCIIKLFHG